MFPRYNKRKKERNEGREGGKEAEEGRKERTNERTNLKIICHVKHGGKITGKQPAKLLSKCQGSNKQQNIPYTIK